MKRQEEALQDAETAVAFSSDSGKKNCALRALVAKGKALSGFHLMERNFYAVFFFCKGLHRYEEAAEAFVQALLLCNPDSPDAASIKKIQETAMQFAPHSLAFAVVYKFVITIMT